MAGPNQKAGPKKPTANQIKKTFKANLAKSQVKKNIQILRSGLPQKPQKTAQQSPHLQETEYTSTAGDEIPVASTGEITSTDKLTNVKVKKIEDKKKISEDMHEWIVFPHSDDKAEIEESKILQQDHLVELNRRLTKAKEDISNLQSTVSSLQSAYKQARDAGETEHAEKVAKQIESANTSLELIGEGKESIEHTIFEADNNLKEINERLHSQHGDSPSMMATAQIGAAVGGFKLGKWLVNKITGKKETPNQNAETPKVEITSAKNVSNLDSETSNEEGHTTISIPQSNSTTSGFSESDLPSSPAEMALSIKSPRGSLKLLNKLKKFGKTGIQGAAVTGASKNALKAGGAMTALLYGIMMHFAALGKAALMGAQIGAAVGGVVGTGAGAYIGVMFAGACGPAALLCGALTVPTMAFLGGSMGAVIGAIAGGLIGLGIASGSATLVSMGVGAGAGGAIGGAIGFYAGTAIGATVASGLVGLAVAACAATLIGCVLVPVATVAAPFIVAGSALVGTVLGVTIGALAGAAIGYVVGEYILNPAKEAYTATTTKIRGGWDGLTAGGGGITGGIGSFFGTIGGWVSAGFSTVGGWIGGTGSAAAGWAGAGWNGIISAGGNALSGAAGAAGDIFGGLFGGSGSQILARIPAIGTGGAVGGAIAFHTFTVGFVTPASKFTPELDPAENFFPPGVNQHFTLTKAANPPLISPAPGLLETRPATFTVTVTASSNLTNLNFSDNTTTSNGSTFTTSTDTCNPPSLPTTLPSGGTWSCSMTINVNATQDGAQISNTAVFTATGEDGTTETGTVTASILVGSASASCDNFEFTAGTGSWTTGEIDTVNQICNTLLARSPTLMALINNAPTITMVRNSGSGCSGFVNGGTVVTFTGCNLSFIDSAKYVVIHELGHVIGNVNGSTYTAFLNSGAYDAEGMIRTYPLCPGNENESFAEMIADYTVGHTYNFPPRCTGYPGGPYTTFQTDYPLHYNFARNVLFGGVTY